MNKWDDEFFRAYKCLDRLIRDMYGGESGVSEYISMMQSSSQGALSIENWEKVYGGLKRIRWVRNQIAHDPSDYLHCHGSDLEFTTSFHQSILDRSDPLALLGRMERAEVPDVPLAGKNRSAKSGGTQAGIWLSLISGIAFGVLLSSLVLMWFF